MFELQPRLSHSEDALFPSALFPRVFSVATSCQYGFLLSFSPLEYGKIGKTGGGEIDWGAGIRLPTS